MLHSSWVWFDDEKAVLALILLRERQKTQMFPFQKVLIKNK